ncbi:hypothetical protein PLEOSDRAFT_163576 [Pleurotus ostreatus PC15]|uniref:Uncharacterized protein n=1 Tax=Pleurotus ostreatus (strain PC15) TaxID=1137138 RepID=A0A067N493_PLEO1|nr:hypothetical protein PLEOSDRAFT_163576 [Pleurotus ostreatus PC15]
MSTLHKSRSDLVAVKGYSGRNLVVVEVKSPLTAFSDQHFAEAMAQAVTASLHTKGDQRFIMIDSKRWKFCVYQRETGKCYVSSILDASDDGAEIVVTALDEWITYVHLRDFGSLE